MSLPVAKYQLYVLKYQLDLLYDPQSGLSGLARSYTVKAIRCSNNLSTYWALVCEKSSDITNPEGCLDLPNTLCAKEEVGLRQAIITEVWPKIRALPGNGDLLLVLRRDGSLAGF